MLSSIQEKAAAVAAAPSTEIPQQEEYSVSSEQQCSMLNAHCRHANTHSHAVFCLAFNCFTVYLNAGNFQAMLSRLLCHVQYTSCTNDAALIFTCTTSTRDFMHVCVLCTPHISRRQSLSMFVTKFGHAF